MVTGCLPVRDVPREYVFPIVICVDRGSNALLLKIENNKVNAGSLRSLIPVRLPHPVQDYFDPGALDPLKTKLHQCSEPGHWNYRTFTDSCRRLKDPKKFWSRYVS